ncbi:MAG: deaminase [Gemmatimonadota bacterium]|nr:deaminase [Gemmatimonadota bacterium]MDH5758191.1 deaminase [Gemmatimonadota bacterium]
MPLIFKDGVSENTHPLNVVEVPDDFVASVDQVTRPPLYEVYMRMADELAKRSTCARLQVGTVITDAALEHVVAIGYNGNVRGFPNRCDTDEAGRCGCIHSEMNALVKAPGDLADKVAFVTASPCVMCAKLMVQAKVSHLYYREAYRSAEGLDVLERAGVTAVHYTRWKDHWR